MLHWKQAKFHKPYEFQDPHEPESGYYLDGIFFLKLEALRAKTIEVDPPKGWPMIFHWQVGGCVDVHGDWGHTENSYHLLVNGCKAADFHFVTKASVREQFSVIESIGFGGVGFYPWWNHPGWHTDDRPIEKRQYWRSPKRGEYIYFF